MCNSTTSNSSTIGIMTTSIYYTNHIKLFTIRVLYLELSSGVGSRIKHCLGGRGWEHASQELYRSSEIVSDATKVNCLELYF